MAMLIEAYGAEGAIALGDRYSFAYLKDLIGQTAEMRKSDEDRASEILDEKEQDFFEKNKSRSIKLVDNEGETQKIPVSMFAVNTDDLFGDDK